MASNQGGRGHIGPLRLFARYLRDSGHTLAAAREALIDLGISRRLALHSTIVEYQQAPQPLPRVAGGEWVVTMASLQVDGSPTGGLRLSPCPATSSPEPIAPSPPHYLGR